MADVEGFMRYAVIDGDTDEDLLEIYLEAAKAWFKGAGVPEPDPLTSSPLYDLGVYRLATFYYDNRAPGGSVNTDAVPYGITGIVLQLRDGGTS